MEKSKIILSFIKPFRLLPPYNRMKNKTNQSVVILYDVLQVPALKDALNICVKNKDK